MASNDVLRIILDRYAAHLVSNPQLRRYAIKASTRALTVREAQAAANIAGRYLGDLMADGLFELSGDGALALADAMAVVPTSLRRNHKFITSLIKGLERDGDLGTVVPYFETDKARNLAKYLSEFEKLTEHKRDLVELVENNSRAIVDRSQELTAEKRYEMGFSPTIIRSTMGGETCDWCVNLAGTWDYNPQSMNKEVFARHRACDCLIELNRNGSTEIVNNYSRRNRDVR